MDRFELYYNFAQSQLLEQDRRWQAIEVKARRFMTISIALLGIAGLIITNFTGDPRSLEIHSLVIGVLVLLTFCCSSGFSMGTLYIRNWNSSPHVKELQGHISNPEYGDAQIIEWTTDAMVEAYIQNNGILENKATMAHYALIALLLEVIFLVALVATAG